MRFLGMMIGAALGAGLALGAPPAVAEVGEDGLHVQPFIETTFNDIREDIETAAASGKRLAIFFEQRGCIYCAKAHEEVYSDPEVQAYIAENFMVIQLNIYGDEEVTDLDGEVLTEKQMATRWGVLFTPTVFFLPEEAPEGGTAAEAAVAVMPGAFGRWTSLHMFHWVREHGYLGEEDFQRYHARKLVEAGVTQ